MHSYVWSAILLINLVTFALYGIDKRRARRGKRRISERTLLVPAALTGAIGAWSGVSFFRHKTRKTSFRVRLVLATAINALWVWLWLR